MFGWLGLQSLDLSNFVLTNVTYSLCMFDGCGLNENTPIGDTRISDGRFACDL